MIQISRTLSCLFILAIACNDLLARQADSDSPEIIIAGRITEVDEQAITNADVILVAHRASFYNDSIFPNGLILAKETANVNGEYKLSFRRSDPRLIGNAFSLYVRSPGFAHKIESIPAARLLVDYPMDVQLTRVVPFQLQILSETGKPLQRVRVAPAFIGEKQIPFNVADQFAEVTDRNGIITLHSARPSSLGSVYATVPGPIDSCNQCVEVKHDHLKATATLLPIRRVRGKLAFETSETSPSFPKDPIRIGFVSKSEPNSSRNSTTFSWCDAIVDTGGNFEMSYWTNGQIDFQGSLPLDFPFVLDRGTTRDTMMTPSNEILLKLLPATLIRGKLVDAETSQGFEGGFIDYFDRFSRPAISQEDGSFQVWGQANQVNFHASTTFGDMVVLGDGFYEGPESLPKNGVITMKPTKLRAMTTTKGRAVDEQGNPVPGLSIKCQYKLGRFEKTAPLLTDRNGNFQFFGFADGTRVTITAQSVSRGTRKPLSVKLEEDSIVNLVISDLSSAQFAGRVVDRLKHPIANATVSIKTAITLEPETFGGVDRSVATESSDANEIVTDANGYFLSAPTTFLSDERSVRVNAPGYVAYHSGWHLPKTTESKEGLPRLELGTISMNDLPKQSTVTIRIVDRETSMPINGASIASLGSRCGQSRVLLTDSSQVEMTWVDTPKILAVRVEGYIPSIESIGSLSEQSHTVKLTKDPKFIPQRIPTSDSDKERLIAAEELLTLVPEPTDKDTFFKKLNYYPLFGFARPEKMIDKFEAAKLAGTTDMILQGYTQELLQLKGADPKRLLQLFEGVGRAALLIQLAERCKVESERDDYFAEAAIELRQTQGDQNVFLSNQLACAMLKLGAIDMAERLLRTTWDNHKELQDIVKNGTRREGRHDKQGVSRYFAPAFAIVDPFASMKLIEFTVYSNEIERLQAEAICFMASQGTAGWDTEIDRLKSMPTAELGVSKFCESTGFRDYDRAIAVVRCMQASTDRTKLLMHIAEKCDVTSEQRLALYQETLIALRQQNQNITGGSLGQLAARFATQVAKWDRVLAEEFLFEAIWQNGANNSWLPYSLTCDIATEIAQCDANLAKTLVKPCFDDWSWLFGDMDNSPAYQQAAPILAMASLDSSKTVAKVKELFSGELADQPSRKLSVVNGIVRRWREIDSRSR